MSWAVSFIGYPDKIVEALEKQSQTMSAGQSKDEFDAALPIMVGALKQNFNTDANAPKKLMRLDANGSGYKATDGSKEDRSFTFKLEQPYYGNILI